MYFSWFRAQPVTPKPVIIKLSMLSKRLHTGLAELAVQLSPRSSLWDLKKRKKKGGGLRSSGVQAFSPAMKLHPTVSCQCGGDAATPGSANDASPVSRGWCGSAWRSCPVRQQGRQQRESRRSGQRRLGDRSVCAAFPKAAAAGAALCEVPCTHLAVMPLRLNCWWTLALLNARETARFAFLETGVRNELPKEFGNEESERQFYASS